MTLDKKLLPAAQKLRNAALAKKDRLTEVRAAANKKSRDRIEEAIKQAEATQRNVDNITYGEDD